MVNHDTGRGECEICGKDMWIEHYRGPIRDGKFGNLVPEALVLRCGCCGVQRLAEEYCIEDEAYETENYRQHLGQDSEIQAYYNAHDSLQIFSHQAIWPESLRGAVVADVGAAGGSFLDTIAGLAKKCVAIEPCRKFHEGLAEKGYRVYPYAGDCAVDQVGQIDFASSFQVIEHVGNPRQFLEEIRLLLRSGGKLILSTPNLDDILLKTTPETYTSFFYRAAHRWYFNADTLAYCANAAGFRVSSIKYVHRYPMSNFLYWLKDARPKGRQPMAGIDHTADGFWAGYLEASGSSDTLFMVCEA